MSNFNSLERGYEAVKFRLYEADCNIPEHIPSPLERRQALMRELGKARGWTDSQIAEAVSELKTGNSFAGAIDYSLPAPARRYYPIKRGWGLWNLRHRRGQS